LPKVWAKGRGKNIIDFFGKPQTYDQQ